MAKNKFVPLGAGTLQEWTPEEMDALAEVTPLTLADARADAQRRNPKLAQLLEAQQDDGRSTAR